MQRTYLKSEEMGDHYYIVKEDNRSTTIINVRQKEGHLQNSKRYRMKGKICQGPGRISIIIAYHIKSLRV